MIDWERRMRLRHYLEQGMSRTAIAEELGISRRTIHRWIASGQLDRDVSEPPRYGPREPRVRKLDPYRDYVRHRLETYPELTAVRLLEEIRASGYSGGITQLKEFVREVRPRPKPEPVVRFETPPGHQAQVDFAHFRLPWGSRWALMVVLGYSRLLWVRFVARQDLRTLFDGLEGAFDRFGGVPTELLFDQMRTVVTRDDRLAGGGLVHNGEFLRFAAHWGFRPRACRPYRAKTKGKVERPIRYLRQSFFYGRSFLNDEDLNDQVVGWLDGVANVRIHRTTRARPRDRFEHEERSTLQPLAARPYHSLALPRPTSEPTVRPRLPRVPVERRSLATYSQLAERIS